PPISPPPTVHFSLLQQERRGRKEKEEKEEEEAKSHIPLTLRLCLPHRLAPNIDAMPPHQHRTRLGKLPHGPLQLLAQVLLARPVLNNRHLQLLKAAKVAAARPAVRRAHLAHARPAARDGLDHLGRADLPHLLAAALEEGGEDGVDG